MNETNDDRLLDQALRAVRDDVPDAETETSALRRAAGTLSCEGQAPRAPRLRALSCEGQAPRAPPAEGSFIRGAGPSRTSAEGSDERLRSD